MLRSMQQGFTFQNNASSCFFLCDYYYYYYYFWDSFAACFSVYQFSFSAAVFSFSFSGRSERDEIPLVCFSFLWAVLDILHGLVGRPFSFFSNFFFSYLYICCFPVLIALMVLSTVLPPYSLMLFSMANWAPQPTVLISRSTHPDFSSFLTLSVLLASGVNCTVKTLQSMCVKMKKIHNFICIFKR